MAVSFLTGKKAKTTLLLAMVGALLVVLLVLFQVLTSSQLVESGIDRASQTFESTGTTQGRLVAMENTMIVLADHPLFGMGYKGIYEFQKEVTASSFAFNVLHPHNFVMSSLSKDGAIGTILLLVLLGYLLLGARRLARISDFREAGAMLFGSMLFFLLFSLMNTTLGSVGYVFWLMAGSMFWLLNKARNEAMQL
jgi:O-antigen ligase